MTGTSYPKCDCRECGGEYERKRQDQLFCCADCRRIFHNRRKERGALLYDLFMINRHERGIAKIHKVWFLITRLAMYWREQDQRERAGRKSWQDTRIALDQATWARATVVGIDRTGKRPAGQ